MWSNPILEGNLLKKGHVRKNWKWRWFRLQGNNLFYFRTKNEERPIGILNLINYSVKATPSRGRQYAFGLFSTQCPAYPLCAIDEEDFMLWMKHLKHIIKKIKLEKGPPSVLDNSSSKKPRLSKSFTEKNSTIENPSQVKPRRQLTRSYTEKPEKNSKKDTTENWMPTGSSRLHTSSRSNLTNDTKGSVKRGPKPNPIVVLRKGTAELSGDSDNDTEYDEKVDEATSFQIAMQNAPKKITKEKSRADIETFKPSSAPPDSSKVSTKITSSGRVVSYLEPKSKISKSQSTRTPRDKEKQDNSSPSNETSKTKKLNRSQNGIESPTEPIFDEYCGSSSEYDEIDTIRTPNISPRGEKILREVDSSPPAQRRISRSIQLMNTIINEITLESTEKAQVDPTDKVSWRSVRKLSLVNNTQNAQLPNNTGALKGGVHRRELSPQELETLAEEEERDRIKKLKKKYISKADPFQKYNIQNKSIGKGSVGEVFFATVGKNEKVAIKKLHMVRRGRDRLPLILREIEIISTSSHHNIVKYIESFEVNEELWVVMEYMSGGSLYDIVKLHDRGYRLNESHTAYCMREILEALSFLHSRHRIHRDIKVDNILLSMDGTVKLADFGTAVQLTFQRLRRNTLAGTPYYMAPELIQRIPYKEKVDIWSIGITILEIMTGKPPFYDKDPQEALELIVNEGVEGLPEGYSQEIQDFVNERCLCIKPDDRSSAVELLKHKYLLKACTKENFSKFLKTLNQNLYQQEDIGMSTSGGCLIL